MKIYLQRPWKFADSPYYKYLLESPPEGVDYVGQAQKQGVIEKKWKFILIHRIKALIRKFFRVFSVPLPNAHLTKSSEKYDLIHCAHCLSINNRPWVTDTEWVGQFWVAANFDAHPKRHLVKRILENKNCKKIMAWTEWAAEGIFKEFPEIADKVEVVYPGIPAPNFRKIKSDKIRMLYVSRRFYFKGGLYALEVMDRITKKYPNTEGIIVSNVPQEVLEKYSNNKNLKFIDVIPQEKLFKKIYPSTDILVYPSFTDTFGFALTEAMAFGIPVVTVGGLSRGEIVDDEKTGFVVRSPENFDSETLDKLLYKKIVDDLTEKVEILVKNEKLREKMSISSRKEIKSGKFSIRKRNKKIKRIYDEALK
ncbi:glycosyltransferase family 4 protein [archaeon]|jgi:glycosyltransferase involved in cell wall biosynthesis|nr:glycosyltransferase family 4 protein [archaeon]MBT3578281.1 glycosyltransferase family 4 protein [archaeon]MBT6819798.1 glycosyltransferase family 4 protein [archaeon]MBT6956159.1 glycosyltransferase family 4 protein [archaeon]MBT7025580.1 glycosyltransferase family 4 protein [archaeon]